MCVYSVHADTNKAETLEIVAGGCNKLVIRCSFPWGPQGKPFANLSKIREGCKKRNETCFPSLSLGGSYLPAVKTMPMSLLTFFFRIQDSPFGWQTPPVRRPLGPHSALDYDANNDIYIFYLQPPTRTQTGQLVHFPLKLETGRRALGTFLGPFCEERNKNVEEMRPHIKAIMDLWP